jgi:Uma2 family endonuclease
MLVHCIGFPQYLQLVELFAKNRVFMTYHDGQLELRKPILQHERTSELLNAIVLHVCYYRQTDVVPLGCTTFYSSSAETGLEPSKSYYLTNIEAMMAKDRLDLAVDPTPDLAIEIEITTSLIPRILIYAQLGIPELWRYDGKTLKFSVLESGEYVNIKHSRAFPQLSSKLVQEC